MSAANAEFLQFRLPPACAPPNAAYQLSDVAAPGHRSRQVSSCSHKCKMMSVYQIADLPPDFPAATRASISVVSGKKRSPMRSQSPAPSVLISTKFKALQHHDIMRQLIVDSQTDKTSPTRCVALVWKGLRLACNIGASKCSSACLKAGNNFRNDSAKARFVPMTTFSLIFLAMDCATACEASTCRTIRVTTLACASPCCGTSPRQRH